MANLDVGSVIGDYRIEGVLGAGGMGKVFRVRNLLTDRVEAMKVLLPDLAGHGDLADRFMREIKLQAGLDHPNIAGLNTALRVDNQLLMVMELLEGETLEKRLKQGPIPVHEAIDYISQVLSALSYAHERGIVHRDIKPGNMMLTPGGVVKLMDFGIAKDTGGHQLTATGTTMGSLYYMSPEQIKGGPALDARADIYSVGISLYEMVTGKRPFDGDSQFAVMSAHLEKNPVPPINIDPTLPASLNDAILMAVEKDAEKRFQTAVAFRAALQTVVTTAPVRAAAAAAAPGIPQAATAAATPRVAAGGAVSAGPRSRRGLWMALGAVFTAAVVIGLVQFGPWRQTRAQEPATPQVVTQPKPSEPAPTVPAAPPAETAPTPAPAVAEPAPVKPAAAPVAKAKSSAPPVSKPAPVQQPVTSTPVPQQAQPVAAQPAPSTPPAAPQVALAPDAAARRAELQQLREELVQAGARAGAVRTTLQNMARSQAASGLGMRADITEAASLMNSYLEGANAALNAGDAASAKDFLEKAGRQLDRLEKFVGR